MASVNVPPHTSFDGLHAVQSVTEKKGPKRDRQVAMFSMFLPAKING